MAGTHKICSSALPAASKLRCTSQTGCSAPRCAFLRAAAVLVLIFLTAAVLFTGAGAALEKISEEQYDTYPVTLRVDDNTTSSVYPLLTNLSSVIGIYGAGDVYAVSSPADFDGDALADNESIFILTDDIYFTAAGADESLITRFTGTLIGNGHTVYDFALNSSSAGDVSFVRTLAAGGTLNGVILDNTTAVADMNCAASLVGSAEDGSNITGCSVSGCYAMSGSSAENTVPDTETGDDNQERSNLSEPAEEKKTNSHMHGSQAFETILNDVSGIQTGPVTLPAGNYTLTSDLQPAGLITVNDGTVRICLNGYSITAAENTGIFSVEGADTVLYVTDCRASSGSLKGCGYGTGVTVISGKFAMDSGHISGFKGSAGNYGVNLFSGAEMEVSGRLVIDKSLVHTAVPEQIRVAGAFESGAKVTMSLTDGSAVGLPFAVNWNSAYGLPGAYFIPDPTFVLENYVVQVSGTSLKFVQPKSAALVAGTITNITGERIGYPDVRSEDISVKFSTLPQGVRVGFDTGNALIIEIPQDCSAESITFLVNGMEIPVSIAPWDVNTNEEYTVSSDFVWTQEPGIDNINTAPLKLAFNFTGDVKYVPMPEVTYGNTYFTVNASKVAVTRDGVELHEGTDYTVSGNEIILKYPYAKSGYTYEYTGHKLGDVNGDGEITIADTSLMTISLNDLADLTDEQIVYANVEQSAQRQGVTLKNLFTMNNYVAEHSVWSI
ncbi:MAG TPA: hypothetical protein O0X97_03155 [Methanocorpusculum sp.]|nr:hypothetical protein [Methanocorpusculum sp.]